MERPRRDDQRQNGGADQKNSAGGGFGPAQRVRKRLVLLTALVLLATAAACASHTACGPIMVASRPRLSPMSVVKPRLLDVERQLSPSFEANNGQMDPEVKFLSRAQGHTLFLTATEAVLVRHSGRRGPRVAVAPGRSSIPDPAYRFEPPPSVLRIGLVGSNPTARVEGLEELPGKANYFRGNDREAWRTGIPTYRKVRYCEIYPGIDVAYYGTQQGLEYDFVIASDGDPSAINLRVDGADSLEVDAGGDLVIHVPGGQVRHKKPLIYQQEAGGRRRTIPGGYVLKEPRHLNFWVGDHDRARPLIIDPVLTYSTYLGGSGDDFGTGIVVDDLGNAYITGWTDSVNFPITGAAQPRVDAFVAKLNPEGNALVYSTYLGGEGDEFEVVGLAVDRSGNAFVTGFTASANFPTTAGAYQTTLRGSWDIFVTKLNPSGSSLVYSTYLGGSGFDGSQSIVVDGNGNAYVAGFAQSINFPTTPGAFQPTLGGGQDSVVVKINPSGSALVYSTYLGGTSDEFIPGLAVDAAGNAYVTGPTRSTNYPTTSGAFQTRLLGVQNAFVTKLNSTGSALLYSTYLGGSIDDEGRDIAVDDSGNAYVTGHTASLDFPITSGAFQFSLKGLLDVYVTKLTPTGSALLYSTYLGGSESEISRRLVIDTLGKAYVSGATGSTDFPMTQDAIQATHAGGEDAFVTRINRAGTAILFSTFLGGSGNDRLRGMTLDQSKHLYVTGFTGSTDFPTVNPLQARFGGGAGPCFFTGGCDAFIAKLKGIVPLTIKLSSSITSVSPGTTLPLKVELSNSTAQSLEFDLVLMLRIPGGPEFPLSTPARRSLASATTETVQNTISIPQEAPTGVWVIRGMIIRVEAGVDQVVDLSTLRFTVVP